MCWTTTTGTGTGAPRSVSTRSMATGPPVEAPISTARIARSGSGASATAAVDGGAASAAGTVTREPATWRTFSASTTPSELKSTSEYCRLSMKSTAPRCSASRVMAAPAREKSERMITGSGRLAMIWSRVAMPPIPGMARSRVTTSGRQAGSRARSSSPLAAVPTTVIDSWSRRIRSTALRMKGESSATASRIAAPGAGFVGSSGPPIGDAALEPHGLEAGGEADDRLRVSQKEDAPGAQGVGELLDGPM